MSDLRLPDFLWQHYYNKHWINFSVKENEIINKAAKKWQKTVSLGRSEKKHIVVYLDRMYQENKVSSVQQNIRCLIYNNGFYSWLYFDDDEGEWLSYTPRLVVFLELAYVKKMSMVKYYEYQDYIVNLEKFQEIEEKSNSVTPVLRELYENNVSSSGKTLKAGYDVFQQILSDKSINLEKRLMNLPSMSSSILNISNHSEQIDISNTTIPLYPDVIEYDESKHISLEVDTKCSEGHKYSLFEEDGSVYTASLSLVDINSNVNKFYIIQLLEHKARKQFALWIRFGRLGSNGQSELIKYYSIEKAKDEFHERFFERTRVLWKDKNNFTPFPGKYFYLETDLSPEKEVPIGDTDLEPSIESLMDTISSPEAIQNIMSVLLYDYGYIPLGRPKLKQLRQGYQALKTIADTLNRTDAGENLITACERFYMIIPHNFGKKSPLLIQTKEDITKKLELLESLWHLREKESLLQRGFLSLEHPFDVYYKSFCCTLEHLDRGSVKFESLDKCLKETHGPTHSNFTMEISDGFQCHSRAFSSNESRSNLHLLWHGSRLTNWTSILSKGLHIAPPEAPSTGSMFGKGLYFADISSKSANYCFATKKQNEGLLLLCEVSLGNTLELTNSDDNLPASLPPQFTSVFCKGKIVPQILSSDLSPDAKAPFGPLSVDGSYQGTLSYNEYVVYSSTLVSMKYLLKVKFNFR